MDTNKAIAVFQRFASLKPSNRRVAPTRSPIQTTAMAQITTRLTNTRAG